MPRKTTKKSKTVKPVTHFNGQQTSEKRPGCVSLILQMLDSASMKAPVTKKQIAEKLAETFPERDPAKMHATVSTMTTWLVSERKRVVHSVRVSTTSNERGYYVDKKLTAKLADVPREIKSASEILQKIGA